MARKHFAGMAIVLFVILFILFLFYLPIEVAGYRPGNLPLLMINAGFLAMITAIMLVGSLFMIVRKDYVILPLATFIRFRHLLFLMIKGR